MSTLVHLFGTTTPLQRTVPAPSADITHTTVVTGGIPMVFGAGNVGRAAVNIAANRLLALGAVPRYLSVGASLGPDIPPKIQHVVEHGIVDASIQAEMEIVSAQTACAAASASVTLCLSASGEAVPGRNMQPRCIEPADVVIVTGAVGAFGTALEAERRNLSTAIPRCDGAPLTDAIRNLFDVVPQIKTLIFPELGIDNALARLLVANPHIGMQLDRDAIPVSPIVRAAADILSVSPSAMPCAASMLVVVSPGHLHPALAALRRSAFATEATPIARITPA